MSFIAVYVAVGLVSAIIAFRMTPRPAPGAKPVLPRRLIWPILMACPLGLVLLKRALGWDVPEAGMSLSMHLVALLASFSGSWFFGVILRAFVLRPWSKTS